MNLGLRSWMSRGSAGITALLLAGCVVTPSGPSLPAMPGSRMDWSQFQADDFACREFATARSGTPADAAAQAGVGSAVAGTLIGAAIGGLLGGSDGAAVGAGMGLFSGSVVGAGNAQIAASATQQRYDGAYFQCMYAAGHRVPAPAGYAAHRTNSTPQLAAGGAPPPNAAIPPPNTPPPAALNSRPNRSAQPAPGAPPPNAAIPPPNTPPPYQLPR